MAVTRILYLMFGLVFIMFTTMSSRVTHGENTDKDNKADGLNKREADHKNSISAADVISQGDENEYDHLVNKRYSGSYDGSDFLDDGNLFGDAMPVYGEKRQASRWKYIYQKLHELDKSKRSPLRWKLIYQKLNSLDNRQGTSQKRVAGGWNNPNWMFNEGYEEPIEHSLQKRHLGRWKNNNWILQQKMNRRQ